MSLIEIKNLSYKYKDSKDFALKNINLNIEQGKFIGIIGHNGSGKSTLSRILNGLLAPCEGTAVINGISTLEKEKLFDIRKTVGVVFQNPDNQLVASIVEDDIAFGPENLGIKREDIEKRITFALQAVGMEKFRKSSPTRLSGGQKQRIAIAGVLAIEPKILILDESTAMLDPKGRKEVMEVVKKLNKNGMTVIHITHYMDEVTDCDEIIVMSDGEIKLQGNPEVIFSKGELLKRLELDIPESTFIANELKRRGVKINTNIYTKEALAEELCRLKQRI